MSTREHSLLRRGPMHRVGIGAVVLLASWMAAQTSAQAQDIVPSIARFEGRTRAYSLMNLATTTGSPVTRAECDATITFRFSGVDIGRANLSFFEGQRCDDPTVRQSTTTTECNELPATAATMNQPIVDNVEIPVSELLAEQCEAGTGSGVQTIWVLALNAGGDAVSGAGQKTSFPLAFDFTPPTAVGSLRATGGEDVATLTWSGGEAGTTYEVFLDPNGCNGATPSSPGLMGETPDPTLVVKSGVSGGTTTVDFPAGVSFGTFVAVAIQAKDRSGNVGSLSNVVCVERFETTSWWDSRCGGGDGGGAGDELCRDDGGTCAASRGRSSGVSLGALLLLALATLVIRRSAR